MNIVLFGATIALALALSSWPALANPIVAEAGAKALSGALATGTGSGGDASNGGVTNKSGDTNALGVALGQAPTAAQGCLKGNKFAFGLLEWTDDSSKCENYRIAFEAARQGRWDLANKWVRRADGM